VIAMTFKILCRILDTWWKSNVVPFSTPRQLVNCKFEFFLKIIERRIFVSLVYLTAISRSRGICNVCF